ncbi:MAG TPA: hypothetical protein VFL87_03455 [Thermoleophilaceae bacterium]|nr:hypothetical protein [Thermoleophilaceae bacterium]
MRRDASEIEVRVIDEADVAAIASLRCLWTGDVGDGLEFERRMARWIASEGEHRTIWLATIGDLPIGRYTVAMDSSCPTVRPVRIC